MASNKRNRVLGMAVAYVLLMVGCKNMQTRDQKLTRGFAEWMLNKAKTEALAEFDTNYVYNAADETWLLKARHDSITYRAALERDADIVLKYIDKCGNANCVWDQIQNTPLSYDYGPGSFINENGEWEYGEHVNNGACKENRCAINMREYEHALKQIYRIRNAKSKSKIK